jgi:glycosyltransferase involved in cell wall biosynthesis
MAYLRDCCGLTVSLVCTGSRYNSFWPQIERCIADLKLGAQVKFLGFVPDEHLRAIYRLSEFLIEPSLFEASSLPIFEAWSEGVPVACSNVSALPEQVLDAALAGLNVLRISIWNVRPGRIERFTGAQPANP